MYVRVQINKAISGHFLFHYKFRVDFRTFLSVNGTAACGINFRRTFSDKGF